LTQNTTLMKLIDTSHLMRREDVVLVVLDVVANVGSQGSESSVFAFGRGSDRVGVVNGFRTRYDTNRPGSLIMTEDERVSKELYEREQGVRVLL